MVRYLRMAATITTILSSPGEKGVTRFEDLCPRITNDHLDTRLCHHAGGRHLALGRLRANLPEGRVTIGGQCSPKGK